MTNQNLKSDANLTTNHQSDEATAEKALFIDWDTSNVTDMRGIFIYSGLDEDNYSLLFHGPFSKRWAKLLGK